MSNQAVYFESCNNLTKKKKKSLTKGSPRKILSSEDSLYPPLESVSFLYSDSEIKEIISILEPHLLPSEDPSAQKEEIISKIQELGKRLCIFVQAENNGRPQQELIAEYHQLLESASRTSELINKIDNLSISHLNWTIIFCAIKQIDDKKSPKNIYENTHLGEDMIFEYNGSIVHTNARKLLNDINYKCEMLTYLLSQRVPEPEKGRPRNRGLLKYVFLLSEDYKKWTGQAAKRGGIFENLCNACIQPPNTREKLYIHLDSIERYIKVVKSFEKKYEIRPSV